MFGIIDFAVFVKRKFFKKQKMTLSGHFHASKKLASKGSLESGKDADIVVFDADIRIQKVFVLGNEI